MSGTLAHAKFGTAAMVGAVLLELSALASPTAQAQVAEAGYAPAIGLGRGWAPPAEAAKPTESKDGASQTLGWSAYAGFVSDYIYRGTTLSDRKPAAGAG